MREAGDLDWRLRRLCVNRRREAHEEEDQERGERRRTPGELPTPVAAGDGRHLRSPMPRSVARALTMP